MHAHDAPRTLTGAEGETLAWPSYHRDCAYCGRPGADQIVDFMPKAIKGLPCCGVHVDNKHIIAAQGVKNEIGWPAIRLTVIIDVNVNLNKPNTEQ